MSRAISLFADYQTGENAVTNYCGLIMKLLYEENPKSFEEVLVNLLSANPNFKGLNVGVTFNQQKKQKNSIPDLEIKQRAFTIFWETKLTNWFYEDQTSRHTQGLEPQSENKILFLLSNFETDEPQTQVEQEITLAWDKYGVILQQISFEYLLLALEQVRSSETFKKFLDEFRIYLDRNNLLPKWKYLLDVVNCAGSLEQVMIKNYYACPDTGGSYTHRRAKYFGLYANKVVKKVFEIRAVVSIGQGLDDIVLKWNNSGEDKEILFKETQEIIESSAEWRTENQRVPLQIFLLANGEETNFRKTTRGGMFGAKQYFWDIAIDCKTSQQLAVKLNDKSWSEFK